jgi:hypothetical protein
MLRRGAGCQPSASEVIHERLLRSAEQFPCRERGSGGRAQRQQDPLAAVGCDEAGGAEDVRDDAD